MTEPRFTFGQETATDAKAKADEKAAADKQAADEKKIDDAKEKKDADAKVTAKVEKKEKKAETKNEKAEGHRKPLPEQLEEIVTKLEKRTEPFSSEERVELQGVQKRLSRTLGDYRDPNPE